MRFSTKGRYGLRAMLDLALNSQGEQVSLNNIAKRQDVSESYMEHVFSALRKAGLVKSIKGPQGGYVLGQSPSNITVGDILRVLEGNLSVVDDRKYEEDSISEFEYCLKVNVWDKINASVNNLVDSITLEDLAKEHRKLNNSKGFMYYI